MSRPLQLEGERAEPPCDTSWRTAPSGWAAAGPPRGPPSPCKRVRDGLTGPGTERQAAGRKHLKVMAGAGDLASRRQTPEDLPRPSACHPSRPPVSGSVGPLWGGSPGRAAATPSEGHRLAAPPTPRWQSPAPLCLPGPSGPRAPQALATHAWTGPWEDKVPSKRSPSARGPKRTAGQKVGAGGWQGTHSRLVQGTQSK